MPFTQVKHRCSRRRTFGMAMPSGYLYSCLRDILLNFALVTILRPKQKIVCSCFCHQVRSRCSHQTLAMYLEGRRHDGFRPLLEFSQRGPTRQAEAAQLRARGPSRASVPTASAWKEMATIACQAARKYQQRKDKQELRAARQEASMRTPRKNAAARSDSVPAAEPTRESILRGLSLKLQNAATWPRNLQPCRKCSTQS